MTRLDRVMSALVLAGVVGLFAGCEDKASSEKCGDGVCDPGENWSCLPDCLPPCNYDGVCDPGEYRYSCEDCYYTCSGNTGYVHDVIVSEIFLPTSSIEEGENGIDLDGDGDMDNKLGQLINVLAANGLDLDLNQLLNDEIATGRLLLLGRIRDSEQSNAFENVGLYRGEIYDATPVFEGDDSVTFAPDADTNLFTCGEWIAPVLETSPSIFRISFPFPGVGELSLTLSSFQIRTVSDPDNVYFDTSAVTEAGWTDVMVGGGLSPDAVQRELIPFLTLYIANLMTRDASAAESLATTFDGNCVVSEIPGCEAVVSGEGECERDTSVDPPVITETEVRCNDLLTSALAPDVDTDGDGENDLLSMGFRISSAVPVTIVEQ